MAHSAKHPSPHQAVASALEAELFRALEISDRGNDMRGVFYDFGIELQMIGDRCNVVINAAQIDGVFDDDKHYARDEEQSVEAAIAHFNQALSRIAAPENLYECKIPVLVDVLNRFFAENEAPLITNPLLTAQRQVG